MELPPEWEIQEHPDYPGRAWYYNKITHEGTWVRPFHYPGNEIEWPPIVFVQHILIKFSKTKDNPDGKDGRSDEEAEKIISRLFAEIVEGKRTFDEIANTESEDESHPNAGELGWIEKGSMPPEFDTIAWRLKPSELSPPFRTKLGWHLVLRRG